MNQKLLKLIIKEMIAEKLLEEGVKDWLRGNAAMLGATAGMAGLLGVDAGVDSVKRAAEKARMAQVTSGTEYETTLKTDVENIRTAIERSGEEKKYRELLDQINLIKRSDGTEFTDNVGYLINSLGLNRDPRFHPPPLPDWLNTSAQKLKSDYNRMINDIRPRMD